MSKISKLIKDINSLNEISNNELVETLSELPLNSLGMIVGRSLNKKKDSNDPNNKQSIGFYYEKLIGGIYDVLSVEQREQAKQGLLKSINAYF